MAHAQDRMIIRGSSVTIRVTVLDAAGARQDLTGASAYLRVKGCLEDPTPVISKSTAVSSEVLILSQVDPVTKGQYDVFLVPGDTSLLDPDRYVYDSWVQLADGTRLPTIEPAVFKVVRAVTEL